MHYESACVTYANAEGCNRKGRRSRSTENSRILLESVTMLLLSSMEINSQRLSNLAATFTGICEYVCTHTYVYVPFEALNFERSIFATLKRTVVDMSMKSCLYINYRHFNLRLFSLINQIKQKKKNYITNY